MKQFFTLIVAMVCLAATAQDRNSLPKPNVQLKEVKLDGFKRLTPSKHKAGRAASTSFEIDYATNEDAYATDPSIGGFTPQGFSWQINTNFPNDSFLTMRDATIFFDSLIENTDQYNSFKDAIRYYPKSKSQLTIDSVYALALYKNVMGTNDTFIFTTFKLAAGFKYTSAQLTANFGGFISGSGVNETWNTSGVTVYSDTFISAGNNIAPITLSSFVSGTDTIYYVGRRPNITLAKGETFAVRYEFKGPIQNTFAILAGYRESCGDTALALQSLYPNSAGYLNFKTNAGNNSGIYRDDFTFQFQSCNRFYVQNWRIAAAVSNNVDFGSDIVATQLSGCPGSPVDVAANSYGSGSYTYQWSTSAGTLSSTTDEAVTLTMPATGDAILKLITTDSLGTTNDTTTRTIKNNGIAIAVNGGAPVSIACGTKATITTVPSGFITGSKKYEWNIDQDPQLDTTTNTAAAAKMGNLFPGNYSVTVTNTTGCTGSTNFSVVYNNGVTNTAAFTLDDAIAGGTVQQCINRPITFTNTSTNQTGWGASWSFGDVGGNTSTDASPTFTYTSAGTVFVNLLMDSAGCVFPAPTKTVQILTTSATQCRYAVGINEVGFDQNVSLTPNPTSGIVNLNVSGAEKNVRISIVNVIGSEVYNFNTTDVTASFNKQIDLNSLSNGTYLVKVQSAGKTAVKRLIVAK